MRSRYSAFVLGDNAYLLQSWHPDTRPETLTLDAGVRWRRLEILGAPAAGAAATEGTVRFVATQQQGNQWHQLTELSRFTRIGQHWLYRDGDAGMRRLDPGRNSPCPCGRGRKFKHCCG
ncbi:SecC motif-containing protein [Isoalcanivorax pacificus W11-5]|uniref:SecC motif-containing protein n=2 Tax=Isoalcanivorax TaxID=3020833 RepID=A0A0B4XMS0_9GAMM|nr:SecC motif-containing protein [Isoalcanivorax pacificus W11-5]